MKNVHGKILVIDLNTKTTRILQLKEEVYHNYLGGRGLGSYLMHNYTDKGNDPLGPDNPAIFLVGPATGTPIPTSSKYCMIAKSPATGTWLDSYASGRIATEIKMAGWDGLIFTGKSSTPCYVYISNQAIEFRDAAHLWGKGAFLTETTILEETDGAGVIAIGPAAEKGVKFACANSDYYRQLGRGGTGTLLASKNLKGIAVKGTGDIVCSDYDKLLEIFRRFIQKAQSYPKALSHKKHGTSIIVDIANEAGMLPTFNFQKGMFRDMEGNLDGASFQHTKMATRGCQTCILPCSQITKAKSGIQVEGPEYETIGLLGSNLGIKDMSFVIEANHLCDDLGLDTMSTGVAISFAMECYERGILSKADTNGLELKFGARDEAMQMISDIAYRRGLGNLLADGVKAASEAIGKESAQYAMQIKGLELPAYDPRAAFGTYLSYAVAARGGCHRRYWPPKLEILSGAPPYTWENKTGSMRILMNDRNFLHCLIACDFAAGFLDITLQDYVEMLGHVTGVPMTLEEAQDIAERTETMIRLYNIREGFTWEDDMLPERFFVEGFTEGPNKGQLLRKEDFHKMLVEYYNLRGWDKKGVPTEETIKKLKI